MNVGSLLALVSCVAKREREMEMSDQGELVIVIRKRRGKERGDR